MIHLLMDTTIYRAYPRRDRAVFRSIEKLALAGYLRLHIPYVVEREFSTASEAIKSVDAEFLEWIQVHKGTIHHVAPTHGWKVLSAYFKGEPPFKGLKCREDIPDAFIWQVVADVANDLQATFGATAKLRVITQDKRLASAFNAIPGVECFGSLDDFVSSQEFNAHNKEFSHATKLRLLEDNLFAYDRALHGPIFKALLNQVPSRQFDKTLFEHAISAITVARVDTVTGLDIHYEGARMLAVDILVLPFTCELHAEVEYLAESDIPLTQLAMKDGVTEVRLGPGPGLTVCRISQYVSFEVDGAISLSFELDEAEVDDPKTGFADDIKSASVSLEELSRVKVL